MNALKFAELITNRRKELGLTQSELGERIGVSGKAVSKWERGLNFPDLDLIGALAAELRLNVAEILGNPVGDISLSSVLKNSNIPEGIEEELTEDVILNLQSGTDRVSELLFGCNLEHTRSCIHTGLSAQMLRNRKFVGKPSACSGHAMQWYPIGEKTLFRADSSYTRHHESYRMKRQLERNSQRIVNAYEGSLCGMGQHELALAEGGKYLFRIVAMTSDPVTLTVSLTSRHGKQIYGSNTIAVTDKDWQTYEVSLSSDTRDEDADIRITFTEKTSLCIGAMSLLPQNTFRGMRWDVIQRLKEAGIKMLRWPGGNFAGEYDWMDGFLPVDMRSPFESYMGIETQPHSLGYDFHEINTDDFIALCREVGAEPFITINPCWKTEEENAAWVEYCNGDENTVYGKLRIQRGFPEPYHVKFWSLGNEVGYGHMEGVNTAGGYARVAREHAQKMLAVDPALRLCSSGPYPNQQWADEAAAPLQDVADLVSQHYYAHNPFYPDAENFGQEYYAAVSGAYQLRNQIRLNRAELPASVKISLDEWNVWYAWYRPSSVTDGIFTAMCFHMILKEAKKSGIELACHFEAINEGVIGVTPYGSFLTAQGQVFAVMKDHVGGFICHSSMDAVVTEKDGIYTATIVNASYDENKKVLLPAGVQVQNARLLTSDTVLPPSFFTEQTILPEDGIFTMPCHSVLALKLTKE